MHRNVLRALLITFSIAALLGADAVMAAASTRMEQGNASSAFHSNAELSDSSPKAAAPAPVPTCGPNSDYIIEQTQGTIIVPGTSLVPNSQCDDCVVAIALPFTFRLYTQGFTSVNASSNGTLQFTSATDTYSNSCLPNPILNDAILPYWDDLLTDALPDEGIYISTTGTAPNRIFNIEWRASNFFGTVQLNFEVRLYEGQNTFDIVYAQVDHGGDEATVGVQRDIGSSQFTQFECDTGGLSAGLQLRFRTLVCGEATFTPTLTPTPVSTCGLNIDYDVSPVLSATIVPGTNLVPNSRCDDCGVSIILPFTYNLYGQPFSGINASSNGNLQFSSSNNDYFNICLPAVALDDVILAYWDDLLTDALLGSGIYTSTTGSAPNRVFNIEWRAVQSAGSGSVNFEVRLYEGMSGAGGRFDIVYAQVYQGGDSATVGVQRDTGARFTQYSCNLANLQSGLQLVFTQPSCDGTSTPTATVTMVASSTATATDIPTLTSTPPIDAILVGHTIWQGRPPQPNVLQQLPITLTLKLDTTEVNYPSMTTDANGFFTVPVAGLANGTYNWRVKGPDGTSKVLPTDPPGFLANSGIVTLVGTPNTSVEIGLMRAGDCNNDNLDTILDFAILKATYGLGIGNPSYDNRADFTGDRIISIVDFNWLKVNFGLGGSPPINPEGR